MSRLLILIVVVALAWQAYSRYEHRQQASRRQELGTVQDLGRSVSSDSPSAFACDGRTHCSQMRSCEEAKYFLANCPGTKMDGDGNGIPCERQYCGGR